MEVVLELKPSCLVPAKMRYHQEIVPELQHHPGAKLLQSKTGWGDGLTGEKHLTAGASVGRIKPHQLQPPPLKSSLGRGAPLF